MVDPVAPTREQLAAIANGDFRLMIALERLFEVAGNLTPTDLELVQQQAQGAAIAQTALRGLVTGALNVASEALAAAQRRPSTNPHISQLQDAIASAHRRNRRDGHLSRLQDVDAPAPTDGDLLSYDATSGKWVPVSGASGSFTTVDSKTVTVSNGIITAIV
tara:strand:+ start:11748 stop:12233 length:486 start_codon:yes stop_codon:yes gene_type:complete